MPYPAKRFTNKKDPQNASLARTAPAAIVRHLRRRHIAWRILRAGAFAAAPGEILAGVALGPYAISVIPASDTLHSIAEGAIFVLFSAGLETSPHELIQVSRKALLVSVAGVIAPFVLGFAYLKLRGDTNLEATFVAAANGRDQRRHNCSSTVRHERVIDSYSEDHSGSSGFR